MFKLYEQFYVYEAKIENHDAEMQKLQNENQTLALELRSKVAESASLALELEEVEIRSTSYFNHLHVSGDK